MNYSLTHLAVPGLKLVLPDTSELLSIFAAMPPAAEAAGSIPFQRVSWNQFAVPVSVDVCVGADEPTETVALFEPVVWVV